MKTSSTFRFAAAAFAAIAAIACSKDDTAQPGNPDTATPFTITASIDDGADTRVSMTDDGATKIEVRWQPGDKIYVSDTETTNYSPYTFTVSDASISPDGKNAVFTCPDFPSGATPQYALHQGNYQHTSIQPSYLYTSETYAPLSTLPDNFLLYAKYDAETKKLAFKPSSAVLKIKATLPAGVSGTLSNLWIGTVDGSDFIYSERSYNITSGTAVRNASVLSNQVQFSGSLQIAENTETELFIVLNPGTEVARQSLEIDLVVGDKVCTAAIKGGGLEAGKCYPLTLGTAKWTVRNIYEGGTGDESTPYQITSETNLRALARAVRAGIGYFSKYLRLMNDVSVTTSEAEPWLPIGVAADANSFRGTFDGNNQTVSGTLHLSDKDGEYLGFFGYVENGGLIKNLKIAGEIVYKGSLDGPQYIGSIAGKSERFPLSGCTHTGAMTVENTVTNTSNYCIGGIVGQLSDATISDCTQSGGTITAKAPNADVHVGGITGELVKTTRDTQMHTCRNESNIVAIGQADYFVYAGALAGVMENGAVIYDCSTFDPALTVTVNGTSQNPVKPIGGSDSTVPCDKGHTARE